MWRSRRRRELVRRWQAASHQPWQPPATWPEATDVRPRHRAPTPRLSLDCDWLASMRWRLIGLAWMAALTGALWLVPQAPAFRIHGAAVSGCQRTSAQQVYDASGLEGASIFRVHRPSAVARILALADVQSAEIRLALPNRVAISIVEWQPLLVWSTSQGTFGVDARGRAIAPPEGTGDWVHVADQSGLLTRLGAELPAGLLDAALAYGSRYRQLVYRDDVGFVVQLAAGWPVWLGHSAAEGERRLAMLDAIQSELGRQPQEIEFVDLRFPERPYFRLRSTEEEP